MKDVIEILNKGSDLSRDEIIKLLNLTDDQDIEYLFNAADRVRMENCGNEVHLRGVIEFSNNCKENCLYCGLREDNITLQRYRMTPDEIIETARQISNLGIRTIVLQSGEDGFYDTDLIAYLIYSIKQNSDIAIALSIGERGFDEYKAWKIAGAERYLLKHETANPVHYSIYHRNDFIKNRIKHLKFLRSIGYQIGSGNIVGLPLQKVEDIADDILLMKELDIDMAAIGPFVPAAFTPYQNLKTGSVTLTLKTIAVTRILLKNVHIPATTALDTVDVNGRERGLRAGANVIMPNFTPHPYRENYAVYANKRGIHEDPYESHLKLAARIEAIGRGISTNKGDSLKLANQ